MKVKDIKPGQLAVEMKKTIRVRAVGEPDIHVGYYNHLRRRGGDVFVLRPVVRKRFIKGPDGKPTRGKEEILITAEQQFSERWMVKVNAAIQETAPRHFNEAGRGRKRLDIPGMTHKLTGEGDNVMGGEDNVDDSGGSDAQIETAPGVGEVVI